MPAHPLVVRVTHWVIAVATLALIVSGGAILLAHPRLYWGEVGTVDMPSLVDLPVPFVFGHSGWGRYLHFLAAWIGAGSAAVYFVYAFVTGHARRLIPTRADLASSSLRAAASSHPRVDRYAVEPGDYNLVQRASYAVVVFLLGPLVLLSGLAFSPALAARAPALVTSFGGQQSARTIHFFAAAAVVVFLVVHLMMVCATGFWRQTRAMVTGAARQT